jgi:cytochrome P450
MATKVSRDKKYPSSELIENPYGFFRHVRDESPVYLEPETGHYLIFDHKHVHYVLQHSEIFPHTGDDPYGSPISYGGVPMISATAPPDHTAMRHLASRPLTPARLRSYEPVLREFVDELIDRFIDRGECEFVGEFAILLPGLVTCRMMGFPESGPDFDFIIDRMSLRGSDQPGVTDQGIGKRSPIDDIHDYMRRALEERHRNPGSDILSEMIQLQVKEDGEFRLDYLITICTELLAGGFSTTAQMMVNALYLLINNPDQMALVRADHSKLIWMFEEALRVESPVQSLTRICVQDCELGGVMIPAGSKVLMVFGSANRDEHRFPDPERFDIERSREDLKMHFGFGYGLHFCVGAPLARLEGKIAFQQMFKRMANIRFAPGKNDFGHIASTHFRALRALHLEFDRAGAEA